ncbi:MAG: hypothetical protein H7066_02340 [Cytophagaceae bacterium]|nr:hypothetical protein [Gemmatimonadaceae bacterium]
MKKSNIPDFSKKQPGGIKPLAGGAKAPPPPSQKQVQKPPTKSKSGRRGG